MEDRIGLAEALSELAGYRPALWCGVAAAIATFIGRLRWQSSEAIC